MRNPVNNLLTPQEQKTLLFLACFFMLGGILNLIGWTPLAAGPNEASAAELSAAVQKDAEIRIDIRVATKEELIILPGIGEKRAADIIAHRSAKPFANVVEIMDVKGIGLATYEKMKPMLVLFGQSEAAATTAKSKSSPKETAAKPVNKAALTSIVNLNTAGIAELTTLSGIGEVKATAIIDYRRENGPFASVDDLVKVKGIGPKTLEKIRHRLAI